MAKKSPLAMPGTGPLVLNARAQEIFDRTTAEYVLDDVARALLRCACEALTRCDECAEIISREGICVPDRYGRPQKHPASILERDHRAAAATSLQKLGLSLGTPGS